MERQDFLKTLLAASHQLHETLHRRTAEWLAEVIVDSDGKSFSIERVYELMCYFSLIVELVSRVKRLTLKDGRGHNRYRLPYGPGNKSNFSFYRFEFKDITYDL